GMVGGAHPTRLYRDSPRHGRFPAWRVSARRGAAMFARSAITWHRPPAGRAAPVGDPRVRFRLAIEAFLPRAFLVRILLRRLRRDPVGVQQALQPALCPPADFSGIVPRGRLEHRDGARIIEDREAID